MTEQLTHTLYILSIYYQYYILFNTLYKICCLFYIYFFSFLKSVKELIEKKMEKHYHE